MKNYFPYSLFILLLFSCDKNGNDTIPEDQFYAKYYSDNILPALLNFKSEAEKEIEAIKKFKNDKNLENFNKMKNQWLNVAVAYSKARVYNYVEIKKQFFDIKIYNFPANVDIIENNINEQTVYNTNYFSKKSSTSKGLATIEYLLFDDLESKEMLNKNAYRVNYLLGVSNEILSEANALIAFWENSYKEKFINATGSSCANNARCLAFNQIINVLDVARVTKLEKPAAINRLSSPNIKLLEAFRSKKSINLIVAHLNEIEYVYHKSNTNFASIVNSIDTNNQLSSAINNSFLEIYHEIDKLNGSLSEAILKKDPQVTVIYNALRKLIRYFSVDGASLLSIATLPTDNDGD